MNQDDPYIISAIVDKIRCITYANGWLLSYENKCKIVDIMSEEIQQTEIRNGYMVKTAGDNSALLAMIKEIRKNIK
jgi:hypothetical protein